MNTIVRLVLAVAFAVAVVLPTPSHAKQVEQTGPPASVLTESKEENAAHAEGRAVDINEVEGLPVSLAADPSATPKRREAMRGYLQELEASARANPEVELFLSPIGGFVRDTATKQIVREATRQEMEAHRAHIHMTIMR